jgi:hypothetical protein
MVKQHWYKVAGHGLASGGMGLRAWQRKPIEAVCECGQRSRPLMTVEGRRKWHREHKALVLDAATPLFQQTKKENKDGPRTNH